MNICSIPGGFMQETASFSFHYYYFYYINLLQTIHLPEFENICICMHRAWAAGKRTNRTTGYDLILNDVVMVDVGDWRNDSCPDELALITLRKCQNINMFSKGIMQIAALTWTCAKYNKVPNRADEVFRTDLRTGTCPNPLYWLAMIFAY